jgi:hypothetical protein
MGEKSYFFASLKSLKKRVGSVRYPLVRGTDPRIRIRTNPDFHIGKFVVFLRRIAYINKLDKPAADVSMTVTSMMRRLETVPLVIQTPLGQAALLCILIFYFVFQPRKNVFRIRSS